MSGNTIVEMVSKELNLLPYQERILQRLIEGEKVSVGSVSVGSRAGWNTVKLALAVARMKENPNLKVLVPNEEVKQRFPEYLRSRVMIAEKR